MLEQIVSCADMYVSTFQSLFHTLLYDLCPYREQEPSEGVHEDDMDYKDEEEFELKGSTTIIVFGLVMAGIYSLSNASIHVARCLLQNFWWHTTLSLV